jgi:hypothetical protein
VREHAVTPVKQWVGDNAHRMLLNAGVVGGDRDTLLCLCERIRPWAADPCDDILEEMPVFNCIAYEHHNVATGPQVTRLSKHYVLATST